MPQALDALLRALKTLPGVGERSAARMAYHLLQDERHGAYDLARALVHAANELRHCERCYTLCDTPRCAICSDTERDSGLLCVVETPADQAALERTGVYHGRYFVLMGKTSPLAAHGASLQALQHLLERLQQAQHEGLRELVLATSFTTEGEASAHLIAQAALEQGLKVTRLARGVPLGSELEYVDLGTVAHAMLDRK